MKTAILALFLCAATSAVCQSAALAPLSPLESGKSPHTSTQLWTNFGQLSLGEKAKIFVLPRTGVKPGMTAPRHWDDAGIDPKIIAHPSQSRLGVQTPGTQVARNEYPNLLMLPIDLTSAQLQATPTQWPSFSIKAIPIVWPKFELLPVHSGVQTISRSAAK